MHISRAAVGLMSIALFIATSSAGAAPVTYLYDSGAFFSSANGHSSIYDSVYSPRFGTHFTAAFTFSNSLDPTGLGLQCLYSNTTHGNCGSAPQVATLLNFSVTSGDFTLDSSNAHIVQNFYPGLEISTYTSSAKPLVPYLSVWFDIVGNDLTTGLEVQGRSFEGGNRTGDINVISGLQGKEALNTGGYGSAVTSFNYTGPGGQLGSGVAAVPEPATWALLVLGFGFTGCEVRRRRRIEGRARRPEVA